MKTRLKTQTLGPRNQDNPMHVLCPGHVDSKTFNQAFKNEGWSEKGSYKQADLNYLYGRKSKNGSWQFHLAPTAARARRITVASWD